MKFRDLMIFISVAGCMLMGVMFAAANTTTTHYSTVGVMQSDGSIEWSETIVEKD